MWKICFFSALHSAAAAAEAALQTIKICGIKRALEYFTLPHRIRLHTWLACSVLFAVCIHDRRRDRCICVGQTCVFVCAHTALTIIIDVLRLLLLLLIWFFNEICMAFCMAVLWCYLDKTVNKRCCVLNSRARCLRACSIILSFVRLFIRYLMALLGGWLACTSYKRYVCAPSDRLNSSVSVEFHFIL